MKNVTLVCGRAAYGRMLRMPGAEPGPQAWKRLYETTALHALVALPHGCRIGCRSAVARHAAAESGLLLRCPRWPRGAMCTSRVPVLATHAGALHRTVWRGQCTPATGTYAAAHGKDCAGACLTSQARYSGSAADVKQGSAASGRALGSTSVLAVHGSAPRPRDCASRQEPWRGQASAALCAAHVLAVRRASDM